nr:conserved hypothetical protein [Serratia symbiotica]
MDLKPRGGACPGNRQVYSTQTSIRNSAAHGKTDDINKNEVSTMINDIESFLIQYLK